MKIAELGKFWFDDTVSPEEMGAIRPLLEKHHAMIPAWCESVHVMCHINDDGNSGCTCEIKTEVEYRRAHLTFFPLWLGEPPGFREQAVMHELFHLYTEHHRQFARDLINLYVGENDSMRRYMFEQLRKVNEATTEDLMLLFARSRLE